MTVLDGAGEVAVRRPVGRGLTDRQRIEIDADLRRMARDADYQGEASRIDAEFATADAETARLMDLE